MPENYTKTGTPGQQNDCGSTRFSGASPATYCACADSFDAVWEAFEREYPSDPEPETRRKVNQTRRFSSWLDYYVTLVREGVEPVEASRISNGYTPGSLVIWGTTPSPVTPSTPSKPSPGSIASKVRRLHAGKPVAARPASTPAKPNPKKLTLASLSPKDDPAWRDVSLPDRVFAYHDALQARGPVFAFTIDLGTDTEPKARAQANPIGWLHRRIAYRLKEAFGFVPPFWFGLGIDSPEGPRLHVHGEIQISPDEVGRAEGAFRLAGGLWGSSRSQDRQVELKPSTTHGWPNYVLEHNAIPTERSGLVAGKTVAATSDVKALARDHFTAQRANKNKSKCVTTKVSGYLSKNKLSEWEQNKLANPADRNQKAGVRTRKPDRKSSALHSRRSLRVCRRPCASCCAHAQLCNRGTVYRRAQDRPG